MTSCAMCNRKAGSDVNDFKDGANFKSCTSLKMRTNYIVGTNFKAGINLESVNCTKVITRKLYLYHSPRNCPFSVGHFNKSTYNPKINVLEAC